MSQDTFPFAEGEEGAGFADEAEAGNRKALIVAGGVAAALVVAAGGWFLLGGGGDDTTTAAFVPHKSVRPAVTAPKTAVKPAKQLPTAYKAQLGRDPFKALYVVPVAAAGGSSTDTTTAPTTTTPTTTTGTTTSPTTTTPAGSTRYTLKLASISAPKADESRTYSWLVAGKPVATIAAQRFGKFGELVVLAYEKDAAGKTIGAVIQVGDDSPIDVKIGESVSVL